MVIINVSTTFFWRLLLCALFLCSKTHYDITMGHYIAKDVHCDTTMSNEVAICIYHEILLLCLIMILLLLYIQN